MSGAPRLETPRLVLRAMEPRDFGAFAAMSADPLVRRYSGDGQPRTEEESWSSFLIIAGHWPMTGYGGWAIEEKASGRFVGELGFMDRKRDRGMPDLDGVPEMGWGVIPSVFGKGYATEAVTAALDWGKGYFGAGARVIALTTEDNTASIRVAQKCGFREFRRGLSAGRPRLFFARIL
ncbi:MAG TPA: GNAT family N-acetyltransferase [Rhizomicrobium sp.]|jgi:RimJ/RimL family protein N-acetyltransferase|nr:GNAT family N-acetyltransferase [Rhizomicrobium sp.]